MIKINNRLTEYKNDIQGLNNITSFFRLIGDFVDYIFSEKILLNLVNKLENEFDDANKKGDPADKKIQKELDERIQKELEKRMKTEKGNKKPTVKVIKRDILNENFLRADRIRACEASECNSYEKFLLIKNKLKKLKKDSRWKSWIELKQVNEYIQPNRVERSLDERIIDERSLEEYKKCLDFGLNDIDQLKNSNNIIKIKNIYIPYFNNIYNYFINVLNSKNGGEGNTLESIHLITGSLEPTDTIFLVFDEHYEAPVRFDIKSNNGGTTYIKKLYDIAYLANAPEKKVPYDKNLADSINNGLFRRRSIRKNMQANKFKKPTLVQKSENGEILVLKNDVLMKTKLMARIPEKYHYLYVDKTK